MDLTQFLKANGASDDDVKALTEGSFAGAAKRAFDAAFAKAAAAEAAAADAVAARAKAEAAVAETSDWYNNTAMVEYNKMQNEVVAAKANEARARAALTVAQERGLLGLVPLRLQAHFERLQAAGEAGWQGAFNQAMRQLLQAELAHRLLPAQGLLDSLRLPRPS